MEAPPSAASSSASDLAKEFALQVTCLLPTLLNKIRVTFSELKTGQSVVLFFHQHEPPGLLHNQLADSSLALPFGVPACLTLPSSDLRPWFRCGLELFFVLLLFLGLARVFALRLARVSVLVFPFALARLTCDWLFSL